MLEHMTGELQYPRQGVHEISATEYCFSSAARIRRALLEHTVFDDSEFEVVMWINSGYYFRHVTRALLETQRVLMPGGTYQNITNGLANKPKHHELVREIKASLGVTSHKPLSASFNLQASQRVIQPLFEQVEPYLQETEYALNRDEVYFLEHSVDTYRSGLSEKQVGRWIEVRKRVIRERVIPEMDANGFWTDNVQRGGGKYRNSYKNVNKRATLWPRTLR